MITEKLILGTVQLGLSYGINNKKGKPDENEAFRILDFAKAEGISLLDTAEAYGNALEIIGNYHRQTGNRFGIISKFKFSPGMNLLQSVKNTIAVLDTEKLFAYLLHDPKSISEIAMSDQLNEIKHQGLIRYSGVSIYTNQQFEEAIEAPYIDIIQIPYNILDNISLRGELIRKAKNRHKIIHTRSVFLQGLFFVPPEKLPVRLQPLKKYITEIILLCEKYKVKKEALMLNYALGNNLIDGVLAGVDSVTQLSDNIHAANEIIPAEIIEKIDMISVNETELLNPANWN